MEKRDFFRQEAIEHGKNQWLGKALLTSAYPAWGVAFLSVLFFIILVLFILFGTYTRRINVNGEVVSEPHAITVFSPQKGYIVNQWVEVGAQVKKGDPLYQIDVNRISLSGNVSENVVGAINNQLLLTSEIIVRL